MRTPTSGSIKTDPKFYTYEMFNNGLMLDKFKESGINNIDDLNKLSEDELGELLKKICK